MARQVHHDKGNHATDGQGWGYTISQNRTVLYQIHPKYETG